MKFVALIFILLPIWSAASDGSRRGRGGPCFSISERRAINETVGENSCSLPKEQLLALPIPEGYDFVMPSTQKVNRCSNLMCLGPKLCTVTKKRYKKFKVEAVKFGTGIQENHSCAEVIVEEHLECGCVCAELEICTDKQIFDEESCSCKCRDDLRSLCQSFDEAMWKEITCTCICKIPEYTYLSSNKEFCDECRGDYRNWCQMVTFTIWNEDNCTCSCLNPESENCPLSKWQ